MTRAKASVCVITATMVTVVALFFLPVKPAAVWQSTTVRVAPMQRTCMLEGRVAYTDTRLLLSPVAGRVAQVCARSGDSVLPGQLLIGLDAQAEQLALAQLEQQQHQQQTQLESLLQNPLYQLSLSGQAQAWQSSRSELLAALALKQIRAEKAATVEEMYVQEGAYVAAGTPLGSLRGNELCITAVWPGNQSHTPSTGMEGWWCDTLGRPQGRLVLTQVSIAGEQAGLGLCFRPADGQPLPLAVGESLPVLLVLETLPPAALVPVAAVGEGNRLWVVENGMVRARSVQLGYGNGSTVQVPAELAGLQVLLNPEQLAESVPVRTGEWH